ncbi:Mevalonate kinase [Olea europaea subsp. europaea]|uniref:Mevalonate kinase n=1 Tax=Olea europaea subsp. europaea TaxID=158383 RepID=A0A8S0PLQ6_OLEEU|nr:Mevalonate kinase [Olea europaea subsp. europaea]
MASVFSAIDSISSELASIIQSPVTDDLAITEKEEKLEELMEMNQGLLQCMGVSHASIETVLRSTLKYKLSSKLTGAGGGGCVLTLLPSCILLVILHRIKLVVQIILKGFLHMYRWQRYIGWLNRVFYPTSN